MNKELLQDRTAITKESLKEMLAAEGPCLSILVPMEKGQAGARQNSIRLRNAVVEAERRLDGIGLDKKEAESLLAPVREYAKDAEHYFASGGTLALLRSPDLFREVRLAETTREMVSVANHFEIRPMLRELEVNRAFYILALARKDVRLLRCTDHSSEEVPLPEGTPRDLYSWAQTAQPDHTLDNRSSAGPSAGSSKGVMFGTTTDREDKDEYWSHFYIEVDKGVQQVLKQDPGARLVLVGVEKELAIYHRITKYEYVVPAGVHGAPDSLKGGEMHKRALEHLNGQADRGLERVLNLYEKSVSKARTSHQVNQCVKAAYEGRVAFLILGEGASQAGSFDEAAQRVKHGGALVEDLLNAAAAETINHGGEVHIVPPEMVPSNSVIAAVLRF